MYLHAVHVHVHCIFCSVWLIVLAEEHCQCIVMKYMHVIKVIVNTEKAWCLRVLKNDRRSACSVLSGLFLL